MIRTQLLCQAGAEEGDQWEADGPEFVDNFQVVMWVQERGGEDDDDDDADDEDADDADDDDEDADADED